jgi:hypothetical protein
MSGGSEGPIPVRELLGTSRGGDVEETAPEGEAGAGGDASRSVRILEIDGAEWSAQVVGRGRTGRPPDAGAPLLLVAFRPRGPEGAEGPSGEGPGEREAWVVAEHLDAVSEEVLLAAFRSGRKGSDPASPPGGAPRGVSR